jgi:hypothetical protein
MGTISAADHNFQRKVKVECLSVTGKGGSMMVPPYQQSGGRMMVGQSHSRANSSTGTRDRKGVNYPSCVKYGQKHPGNYSVSPGRCFVCRGEGHKWRNCQYLGKGIITVVEEVIIRRTAPIRTLDRFRQLSQRHQQSVTVNRPVRSSQSGANSSRGRLRAQNDQTPGRVFHLT